MSPLPLSRRKLITEGIGAIAGLSGLGFAGRIASRYGLLPPDDRGIFGPGEALTYATQHLLTRHSLAREFPRNMISTAPFANVVTPTGEAFQRMKAAGFAGWTLAVDGMVSHPLTLTIADLRALAVRGQITQVVCEEGWSYIAEWIGTPLSAVLLEAGMLPQARYVVYCALDGGWWDSIDMADALHPQTLLTWGMNDGDLPTAFGGPLRMRLPRQIGYKSVKYLAKLTVTDSLKHFGKGLGSVDSEYGYAWYAGM